jgi:Icc-related predicted phosphoesterase
MKATTEFRRKRVIAAVGDVHGSMHAMIRRINLKAESEDAEIAFVLSTGDFEPIRDQLDMDSMACPKKFRVMGDYLDFHEKRAFFPWPLYFIGGNHEPYRHLEEFPNGGMLAHNCNYLGRSGQVILEGVRITYVTGVFSPTYFQPADELVRNIEGRKRRNISLPRKYYTYYTKDHIDHAASFGKSDILMTHEWPLMSVNTPRGLMDIGSEPLMDLATSIHPKIVISGHMHYPLQSTITYEDGTNGRFIGLAQSGPVADRYESMDDMELIDIRSAAHSSTSGQRFPGTRPRC